MTHVSAAAGDEHALALTEAGEVFAWGKNYHGQLGIAADELFQPTRVFDVSAAAGENHALALTAAGEVFAWGYNIFGLMGFVSENEEQFLPRRVFDDPKSVTGLVHRSCRFR